MPTGTYNHPLFGLVKFETDNKTKWVRGDHIKFISGFNDSDIQKIAIPQLVGIHGSKKGEVQFHKRGHKQLLAVFSDIEKLNLLDRIKKFGTLNKRLRKPTNGALSKLPSNHAFGTAIDLNDDDGCLGCTIAPLAPLFEKFGFLWGKSFNDPMHFEIKTFIDNPKSVVEPVAVALDENALNIDAVNFMGHLYAPVDMIAGLMTVSEIDGQPTKVLLEGKRENQLADVTLIGSRPYVTLASAAGVLGTAIDFDNTSKRAALTSLV